jgi:signal transduction histidine kinase
MALAATGHPIDLQVAISDMAELTAAGTACECTVRSVGVPRLVDPVIGANVLAVCREAVGNSQRYARATALDICLNFEEAEVEVEIRDNGRGFSVDALTGAGFGLTGMRVRAHRMGGTVTITRTPGSGTRIVLRVPDRIGPAVDAASGVFNL